MKKYIAILALLLCTASVNGLDFRKFVAPNKKVIASAAGEVEVPLITLTEDNTVVLRGVVDGESVTSVQRKIFALSAKNRFKNTIYLVLDTPGGDVVAGQELISSLKALPQEIKTITNFAASMGFITAQSLGERLILPHGTLMSHRARGGAQGQIPGELNSRVNYWTKRIENIEKECAARMKMPIDDYKNLILNELWVDGQNAVELGAADKVILARCDRDLMNGTVSETVRTLFGSVLVTWSACPLISYPLEINFAGILDSTSDTDLKAVKEILFSLIYNKQEFVNKYLNSGIYQRYVK